MDWILDVVVVFLSLFELCYDIELCVYDDVTMFFPNYVMCLY
jgi:hypothetical protein